MLGSYHQSLMSRWVFVLVLAACGDSSGRGTVLTPDGTPVPGATVTIGDAAVTTNDDGQFVIEGSFARPSDGPVEVTVRHVALAKPHVERLQDTDGMRIQVRIVPTARGRVVDDKGKPMKHASVVVRATRRRKVQTTTDDEGYYQVAAPRLSSRPLEAAASAPGYLTRAVRNERKTTLLDTPHYGMPNIVLTFCGIARGRVVTSDGQPAAGADVKTIAVGVNLKEMGWTEIPERLPELGRHGAGSHYGKDGFSHARTRGKTDSNGRYALTTSPPDRVLFVIASLPGGPPRRLELKGVDLSKPLPDLVVPPLSKTRVPVQSPDGQPIGNATVYLVWPYPHIYPGIWTSEWLHADAKGWITLPCAEPGVAYEVVISGGGMNLRLTDHVIEDGEPLIGKKR